jgi:hypothetical protein
MAGFDEQIVREYFELHGFHTRQLRKYPNAARGKLAEEEIDLAIINPTWSQGQRDPQFLLFATELPYIRQAIVSIQSWPTQQRFTPNMLRSSSDILKFLEKNVLKPTDPVFIDEEEARLPEGPWAKILVLPSLPTTEPQRTESIRQLKLKGVDGMISMRTMLIDILQKMDSHRNYLKSDTLQLLRMLRNYDLLKDPQLDLFQ